MSHEVSLYLVHEVEPFVLEPFELFPLSIRNQTDGKPSLV